MKEYILLNATAAASGGSLSILRQFLYNFPAEYSLIAFISVEPSLLPLRDNIVYVHSQTKSWFRRIFWDYWGLQAWCKKSSINPILVISLQNTGVRLNRDVKQLIYYHQAIPLYEYQWNFLKKSQRALWLYKNIYPWFVKAFIHNNTRFVTQFDWVKRRLAPLLKIHPDNIMVNQPGIEDISLETVREISLSGDLKIFYPATAYPYKNHLEIVNAFIYLKNRQMLGNYVVYFTCDSKDVPELMKLIRENNLEKYFIFSGKLEYADVLRYYKSCDVLVFPSFLESFGLPVLEAAAFGRKILLADLDYAREAANDYEGAEFIPIHNPEAWGRAIEHSAKNKSIFRPWSAEFAENSWERFFVLVSDFLGST